MVIMLWLNNVLGYLRNYYSIYHGLITLELCEKLLLNIAWPYYFRFVLYCYTYNMFANKKHQQQMLEDK